ncbi:MAG: SNF2-related protein [bacterium]
MKTNIEKKKSKRKAKTKQRRIKEAIWYQKDKVDDLLFEAQLYRRGGRLDKALLYTEKALRVDPKNKGVFHELAYLGHRSGRKNIELKGLLGLYHTNSIQNEKMPVLCDLLAQAGRYEEALTVAQEILSLIPQMKPTSQKNIKASIFRIQKLCTTQLENRNKEASIFQEPQPAPIPVQTDPSLPVPIEKVQEIPIFIELDTSTFYTALTNGEFTTQEGYELALEGYKLRFRESFENLICLFNLKGVRSLWYQEETAKKVLKTFRGRALLSDEVGLGKTIESLIVLKEYIRRGMVNSALILTPTPLVSQWKEELLTKFELDFPSTDDSAYRTCGTSFWEEPFILASINLAKSKKNFNTVVKREYDMVIVDEAHHLKNRATLNWKLVNALKKRFLLLLTATPVENNLMELYNLITLLKPGQLKTASAFREEFMTRGDPTDPQNRGRLKELLGQVMIRNTRSLARIDIPPRFAQTIKVDCQPQERELYERVSSLVKSINKLSGKSHKLLLKNLLAQAGSSPKAVSQTLERILTKRELLVKEEEEIKAITNLCHILKNTSKNNLMLKLLKSSPGKMIIFVKYRGTLDHLSDFLIEKNIPHALFHGSMDNRSKDEQIRIFREERDVIVTTEIGGEGRNLQFCHQMINYDLPWNPMKIEQRIGRLHRIGQKEEVMIYNLCARGSIEDYILEILDKKINMFELVIGEIEMILGRMKDEQEFSEMVYDIWINAQSDEEREKSFNQLAGKLTRSKKGYEKTKELDEKLFGENYEL